jgi:hypothetical protein
LQTNNTTSSENIKKGFSGLQVIGISFLAAICAVVMTFFAVKMYFFPSLFTPVVLTAREQKLLDEKLEFFAENGVQAECPLQKVYRNPDRTPVEKEFDQDGKLLPKAYDEKNLDREVNLSEREINALLAKNTELASKLVFDLSESLISAKLLIPVDPDFPVLGGKIIRARAGVELAYNNNRPIVKLRGISLMGVPIPNAWLGGLKNIDLVSEFGNDPGFWNTFADGVKSVEIKEGYLKIVLNE